MTQDAARVGIFGAGKAGSAIARLSLAAGHRVHMASTALPELAQPLLDIVAPGAHATTSQNLAPSTDILVLAVPLSRFHELPLDSLTGRIVIDAMNYWPALDGSLAKFETGRPSSAIVRDALPPDTQLVKTFNHLGYHQLEDLAGPVGASERVGMAVAGDDADAVATIGVLIDEIGFDPVTIGSLEETRPLQPDGPVFGRNLSAPSLRALLTPPTPGSTPPYRDRDP